MAIMWNPYYTTISSATTTGWIGGSYSGYNTYGNISAAPNYVPAVRFRNAGFEKCVYLDYTHNHSIVADKDMLLGIIKNLVAQKINPIVENEALESVIW